MERQNFVWLGVIAIAFAAFIFNTSEFIPIGLLSAIAKDFGVSQSQIGILISGYAFGVALMSLPLMLLFSKMELKKLLLGTMSLFVVSHILSSLAESYILLFISRMGVACSHALFWSIATPMAVRVAPKNKQSLALSLVVAGSVTAFVMGLPLGRVIGLYMGWRITFLCIGIVAFVVLVIIWRIFPNVPSSGGVSIRTLPKLFKTPYLLSIYILAILLPTAHFSVYSYIEPFWAQIADFSKDEITWLLVLFGSVGFVASFLFSKYYDKYSKGFTYCGIFGITLSLFLLELCAFNNVLMIILCIIWGFALSIFNLALQSKLIAFVPSATSVAMSMLSGIYNIGIGGGAFIGGVIVEKISLEFIGYAGGIIGFLGCLYYLKKPF
ncbi:sugar transporter [Helicobacter mesocricetorum]|uniref:sugar transporter n=1 Tax=Helicobacter mesocricetorum TaxID=87012 RepID=UPI000CF01DBB|nr:sugar transporter [Helicobacter mesocricetorum]